MIHQIIHESSQRVLVNLAILHDHDEILRWIRDELNIRQWIAVDKQHVGERAFGYDPQCSGIRTALTGQREQLRVIRSGIFSACAGVYHRNIVLIAFPTTKMFDGAESRSEVPLKMRTFSMITAVCWGPCAFAAGTHIGARRIIASADTERPIVRAIDHVPVVIIEPIALNCNRIEC